MRPRAWPRGSGVGGHVAFLLCLLPGESHPLPTSQTPDTCCLPPPDTRWLPLFALPSRPFGPLPVPARGSRAQPLPGGASHPLNSQGLLFIRVALPPAGLRQALTLLVPFLHSEEHWPIFVSAPPPKRQCPGHGPLPLPAPAARWRPHSAFNSGLPGWGSSAVSSWKVLEAGLGSLAPPLFSATCLSFPTLTSLSTV